MAALNKVMLIGNLGRDPEVRMAGSSKVANFSIAVKEKYKNRQEEWVEKTEWVNIVAWSRLAEIVEQYVGKGSPVYIEGKLQTTSWDGQDGVKKYKTEVVAHTLQMLGKKREASAGGNAPMAAPGGAPNSGMAAPGGIADPEDDLPF